MEANLKFEPIALGKLDNDLYRDTMVRFDSLITVATPEKLGIAEYMPVFTSNLNNLKDLLERPYMYVETAELGDLDKQRDQLFIFINQMIRTAVNSPVPAQKAAADVLSVMMHPYAIKNATRATYAKESGLIEGMLLDAYKPENLAHFTTLGLKESLEQLKSVQAAFKAKTEERSDSRKLIWAEKTKDSRSKMDVVYGRITDHIVAKNILEPSADINKFIEDWNVRIKEIRNSYKQSQSMKEAARKKKTDTADESGTNTSGRPPSEAPQA